MPVTRFRTFRDARLAQWMAPDDPRLPDRIRRWWRTSARLLPTRPFRGVQRFRTLEEADAECASRRSHPGLREEKRG